MNKFLFLYIFLFLIVSQTEAQEIDLTNWKVTIPEPRPDDPSKPISVRPPEIQNFEDNEVLKPFFYKDESDNSLVFYAYPAQSTKNTKYSRTEFREQIEPGNDDVNWTFKEGGHMRGTLSVPEISQASNGDYHRVIIMQIHGRLTDEQRDLIGEDDNNAPPMLKIYWDEGKVRVKTKVLKDPKASDEEILHESAWGNDKGRNFKEIVGNNKFTLEVNVSDGKMEITLNDNETFTYDGVDIERWGVFENYFKAGNYFQSRDQGSFAKVKYYELEVTHSKDGFGKKTSNNQAENIFVSEQDGGIDLTNWRAELPSGYKASDWKLSNYENDMFAKPFLYKDSIDGALVLEAYPSEGTSKAKYTRNNLREQIQPGSNDVNWTMKEGGVLEAEFQVQKMSKDPNGNYHKTILFQIDGRTSPKQNKQLGLKKSVGIPLLKVYWQDEKLFLKRKILKDETLVGDALLSKSSWKEDKGIFSREKVGFEKTQIRIELKKGKLMVFINDEKPIVYRDLSLSQWYFENYFTVGNYLQSKDEGCHSIVKFHNFKATHEGKK